MLKITKDKFRIQKHFLSGSIKILTQELYRLTRLYSPDQYILFNGIVYSTELPLGWETKYAIKSTIEISPVSSTENIDMYEYLQLISKIERKYIYIENMIKEAVLNLKLGEFEELGLSSSIWDSCCREFPIYLFPVVPKEKRISIQTIKNKHTKAFDIIAKEKALNLLI